LIVFFDLRRARFDIAVALIVDDDTVRRDLGFSHLEGCRDGAPFKQTFSLTERDRKYHQVQLVDEIACEKRLKQIRASEDVQIRSFRFFQLSDFIRQIAAQKDGRLPIAEAFTLVFLAETPLPVTLPLKKTLLQ
jgi:hypothetical protein